METVIKIKNLEKIFKVKVQKGFLKSLFKPEYNEVAAVKGINFDVKKGESVAFLGPNGAGKTTTTKMMTGLIYPSNGSVEVLGYTPFERDPEFLSQIGLVMGNKAGLNWDLTPNQSFNLFKQIYRINDADYMKRVKELTEMLNVETLLDTQVRKMSLGERMKMELIGSILHYPKILFLDEPTIGLDITSKQTVREFLRKIQKELGITLVLTSHDMDDVEKVCDRVIIINKGEKIYDDSIDKLNSTYQDVRYVKFIFKDKPDIGSFKQEVISETANSVSFRVKTEEMPDLVSEVTSKYKLEDIEINSTPLEEMISDLFGK